MLQLRGPAECEKPAESVGCLKWYDNLPLQQTIVSCRYNELFLFLSGNKLGESKCANTQTTRLCSFFRLEFMWLKSDPFSFDGVSVYLFWHFNKVIITTDLPKFTYKRDTFLTPVWLGCLDCVSKSQRASDEHCFLTTTRFEVSVSRFDENSSGANKNLCDVTKGALTAPVRCLIDPLVTSLTATLFFFPLLKIRKLQPAVFVQAQGQKIKIWK